MKSSLTEYYIIYKAYKTSTEGTKYRKGERVSERREIVKRSLVKQDES